MCFAYLVCVFVSFSVRVCMNLFSLCRMRCADISAERDTEGQWTTAKAVFNGAVTGTVRLVRSIFH